jgi:hypothetical protein
MISDDIDALMAVMVLVSLMAVMTSIAVILFYGFDILYRVDGLDDNDVHVALMIVV